MQQVRYVIRSMTRPEFDLALDWAAAEGWNPGLHDAAAFHAADPEGFLIGQLVGRPVAMISAVRYGQGFGFIGFYSVRPNCRKNSFGEIRSQNAVRMAARKMPVPVEPSHAASKIAFSASADRSEPSATGATGAVR